MDIDPDPEATGGLLVSVSESVSDEDEDEDDSCCGSCAWSYHNSKFFWSPLHRPKCCVPEKESLACLKCGETRTTYHIGSSCVDGDDATTECPTTSTLRFLELSSGHWGVGSVGSRQEEAKGGKRKMYLSIRLLMDNDREKGKREKGRKREEGLCRAMKSALGCVTHCECSCAMNKGWPCCIRDDTEGWRMHSEVH
jgi:hypothetical protein